jgi:ABC transporter with metal-binding/Fe-S-binding domain ATP-binding protein
MKAAALFSGGKDSTLAIHKAISGGIEVLHLVSIFPKNPDSYMFHYPNIKVVRLLSEAMGIPLVYRLSDGRKEEELKDLEEALRSVKREIDAVVVGALESSYQRERVEAVCGKLDLKMVAPLWGTDRDRIWEDLLREGFRVVITKVSAGGLDRSWLGRIMDENAVKELLELCGQHGIHPGGEGGEFETTVLDCPVYRKRLEIVDSKEIWEGDSGMFLIKNAILIEKGPKEDI